MASARLQVCYHLCSTPQPHTNREPAVVYKIPIIEECQWDHRLHIHQHKLHHTSPSLCNPEYLSCNLKLSTSLISVKKKILPERYVFVRPRVR